MDHERDPEAWLDGDYGVDLEPDDALIPDEPVECNLSSHLDDLPEAKRERDWGMPPRPPFPNFIPQNSDDVQTEPSLSSEPVLPPEPVDICWVPTPEEDLREVPQRTLLWALPEPPVELVLDQRCPPSELALPCDKDDDDDSGDGVSDDDDHDDDLDHDGGLLEVPTDWPHTSAEPILRDFETPTDLDMPDMPWPPPNLGTIDEAASDDDDHLEDGTSESGFAMPVAWQDAIIENHRFMDDDDEGGVLQRDDAPAPFAAFLTEYMTPSTTSSSS